MIPAWAYLNDEDRAAFRAAVAFLNKRLAEQATIDWALSLKRTQRIERLAIEDLLDSPSAINLDEPWATAWRLIEEGWSAPLMEEGASTAIYGIQKRLRAGDRSGAVISNIVGLVAPSLKVEPLDAWRWQLVKKPRHPKTFDQLLHATLTSGDLVDLNVLNIASLTDVAFLRSLGSALEYAVNHGLEIAKRLGWDGQRSLWRLGFLSRVYYTQAARRYGETSEPDAYHRGIAPSVKLLWTVVARLAELEAQDAMPFIHRWRMAETVVHTRLWAAAARNSNLVGPEEAGAFLKNLDDRHFWDLDAFPEIAELRSIRFSDLAPNVQKAIAKRVRKGPPRNHWPRKADEAKVGNFQLYWTVRELKRIEVAGGDLPADERSWLNVNIGQFSDLAQMNIEEGFSRASEVYTVLPNPDEKLDALSGLARLRALEVAFSTARNGWGDDPAERASEWLRQPGRIQLLIGELEATGNGGNDFPHIWSRFGWAHSPKDEQHATASSQRNLQAEANRVLVLLNELSKATLAAAIEGISAWLDAWEKQVVASALGLAVWLRIWPIAVEATNARPEKEGDANLSVTASNADDDSDSMDIDTLNTPTGKLVGVFLAACPSLNDAPRPFESSSAVHQMRGAMIDAAGRSGLIVRHRLIEALPYFLRADRSWAEQYLISPLLKDDGASLALWRAIARRTHFTEVLKIIGNAMAERSTDRRLGRETRQQLVFSLVIESLHAFREGREAAVSNPRVQQMLRTIDDEVRAYAANAIQRFIYDLSVDKSGTGQAPSAADLFRSAAAPFLQHVWPQERSLATPGVSSAFADLPATSGEAFVEAVDAIERFLVPFECWSMLQYGLYGEDGGKKKLTIINTEAKAEALLRLFDLTIGNSEGSVIPYNLTDALDRIRSVAPELAKGSIYRRLSTAARR
ncbi:hypothetical protein [Pseudorhodoplanes sinuspersici]|uniref:Uncharacterized protein n=1 Tax=Pseudorhodoplanes sinuspersici TaxID=1235591 RepID=A0A1W6ZVZ5_9HYPH|nr:hypothetical protein [Pseudorhodoplanes sinuspersici]ARQ00925.1 hypothetical protein CAK95_18890 [Pseudorhodoplanes sinuspersici]RKE72555.1 hypothetical protein DFP91_0423 [Pseudorhodoplanes sinuspersici]